PFQGIGGLDYANRELALSLDLQEGSLCLGLAATRGQSGTLSLDLGGTELLRRETQASPESPYLDCLSLPPGLPPESVASFTFADSEGEIVASYQTELGSLQD
ncbi:MAG: hypothetical protein MUP64_14785, partial [Anaerolineae bacterium]|nr:hypothetical protein [Anaerolineae bacterium]